MYADDPGAGSRLANEWLGGLLRARDGGLDRKLRHGSSPFGSDEVTGACADGHPSGHLGPRHLRRSRLRRADSGHQHRDAAPVLGVPLTVELDEIPLLESYRDQNVGRGQDREEEVRCRHRWRRPEGEQPADVEGMPHVAVRTRSDEAERPVRLAPEVEPHLPEPEQVEVVDEEGGDGDGEPAGNEEPVQRDRHHWVLDVPDHAADRAPLQVWFYLRGEPYR